jgi:predicted transcriptional regulator
MWKITMVRRSRLEIYFDVLKVIDNGTDKPTRIMYETNLSWTSVCSVFDALINSEFIRAEKKKTSTRYYITVKGKNALSYHMRSLEGLIQNE